MRPLKGRALIAAIGTTAVLVGLMAVLVLTNDDPAGQSNETAIVSVEQLREEAREGDTPIYWAGPQDATALILNRPAEGQTQVRYLAGGATIEGPVSDLLTVGTYVDPDPVANLRRRSANEDGVLASAPGGATVYFTRDQPQNVYLAFPDAGVQVEVYDPDAQRALELVTKGEIVAID